MSRAKLPLAAVAALALVVAGWAGFTRFGLLPQSPGESAPSHGALFVSGAIGTLIGLERAIAVQRRWAMLAPALSAAAAVAVIVGIAPPAAAALAAAGALAFLVVTVVGAPASPGSAIVVMALGAAAWLAGATLWAQASAPFRLVPWWMAFLVLTITAERMELARALRPSHAAALIVVLAAGTVAAGTIATLVDHTAGTRVMGAGALVLALWLALRDRPPFAARRLPLPRFIATAIRGAYGWLAVGGLLMVTFDGIPAGWRYDAMVHAVFAGFVLSMILAHAPIVLPAVVGVSVGYRPWLYVPLGLLWLSVLLRLGGDVLQRADVRDVGATGVAIAVGLFAAAMASSARRRRSDARSAR